MVISSRRKSLPTRPSITLFCERQAVRVRVWGWIWNQSIILHSTILLPRNKSAGMFRQTLNRGRTVFQQPKRNMSGIEKLLSVWSLFMLHVRVIVCAHILSYRIPEYQREHITVSI
jgi:hypothetical protein